MEDKESQSRDAHQPVTRTALRSRIAGILPSTVLSVGACQSRRVSSAVRENEIRLGVEVDGWGRPVAYYVNPYHPSDQGGSLARERIPAEFITHLYDPARVNQTRGVTWFHPVMLAMRILEGYIGPMV